VARNPLGLVQNVNRAVCEAHSTALLDRARRAHRGDRLHTSPAGTKPIRRTPGNPTAETDSVAGHIGFELRCAGRIFISLRCRRSSELLGLAQTVAPSQENNILRGLDCWLSARAFVERRTQRPSPLGTSAFESSQRGNVASCDIGLQVSRSARCSRMLRRDMAW
jgi:hypothetical protein